MKRILAVDDDSDILEVIQYIPEDSGYEVETLTDGHYLFDKIREKQPDLILLDIMLGNLDGRDLCRIVKTRKETHDIPVILISASHDVSGTLNQIGGPNDYIAKPFDIDDLLRSISRQLNTAA
jgi:DNA-binding response OmpR family regulator